MSDQATSSSSGLLAASGHLRATVAAIAGLLMLAAAAHADDVLVTVGGEGSCPSPAAVASVLRTLGANSSDAAAARAIVRDEGESFVVQVGEHTKRYVDRKRRCDERARVAAAFVALQLDAIRAESAPTSAASSRPPGAGAPTSAAGTSARPGGATPSTAGSSSTVGTGSSTPPGSGAASPDAEGAATESPDPRPGDANPAASAGVPRRPSREDSPVTTSSGRGFSLGLHGQVSLADNVTAPSAGLGLLAAWNWSAWGTSASCSALTSTPVSLPSGSVQLLRVPCHASATYRRALGPVSAELGLGVLLGYLHAEGRDLPQASGGARLEAGARTGLVFSPARVGNAYPYLIVEATFSPLAYELTVAPLGTQAHTPRLWGTLGLGFALRP